MSKQTYTVGEAAAELGVSASRVRQMTLDGELSAERFGRALVITRAELDKAKQRKTSPGPAAKAKTEAVPVKRARKSKTA